MISHELKSESTGPLPSYERYRTEDKIKLIVTAQIQNVIPWAGRTLQLAEKPRGEFPQFPHRHREDPVRKLAGRERPALLRVPQSDPLLSPHIGYWHFSGSEASLLVWHVATRRLMLARYFVQVELLGGCVVQKITPVAFFSPCISRPLFHLSSTAILHEMRQGSLELS